MKYEKIDIYDESTRQHIRCLCFGYEQFVMDCDYMTQSRLDGFGFNPKDRYDDKVDTVLREVMNGERHLPSRFMFRTENRYTVCNCRIDYVFELMNKEFLKENAEGRVLTPEEIDFCLREDIDYILSYIGMNR